MLANGDPMVHVQEITNDISLIGLRKPEPIGGGVGERSGGHQLTWSPCWGCSPRLTDASVKWQTHGRKIASWDGSVAVP